MKTVSIILPVYNGETTIEQTIQSALQQTYEKVQVVVVNDGSKDSTALICERLATQYPQMTVIHQENAGVSAARNRGIEAASGSYIAFLDADDTMEASFCEEMVQAIEGAGAQMAVCGYYNESDTAVTEWMPQEWSDSGECAEGLIKTGGIYCIWNKLFIKEQIHQLFNTEKSMSEDLEFVCHYMEGIKKTVSVQSCLYHYQNDNATSLSHTVRMTPLQILEEYQGLKSFVDTMQISIPGFENRLVFATIHKLKSNQYHLFKEKWQQFREKEGFQELVNSYAPTRTDYKLVAYLIRFNMPLLVYIIVKLKL